MKPITTKLPYRCGAISKRGACYWAVVRDSTGADLQINTRTADPVAALKIAAHLALPFLRAKLAALEALANAAPQETADQGRATDSGDAQRRVRKSAGAAGSRGSRRGPAQNRAAAEKRKGGAR